MKSSWVKPESKMQKMKANPAPNSEEAADIKDNQEMLEAKQKLAADTQAAEDKVGALFGGHWFITNWTDPILIHPVLKSQMTVHRFYPQVWVAVDIFTHIGDWERQVIALKREAFKNFEASYGGQKHKVSYGALSYSDSLAALIPQLEA